MVNNDLATIHFLSLDEIRLFEELFLKITSKISDICEESELPGNWTVSEDFKHLVKIGE